MMASPFDDLLMTSGVICRASDLWGGLSFVDKETSEVVCPQVGTNYLRGRLNAQQIATHLLAGVSPREMQSSRL